MFIRYLILIRGIEEGLLASTREKHSTVLGKVNKRHYNHNIFVNYAAKNFRVKENSISCPVS